jgi:EAL domain-containing protein (putative c-di-GMP-specific phosphodiesterase class I)
MPDKNTVPALRRTPHPPSRRVLIADDEQKLARAIQRALTAAGFDAVMVHDGNAAIQAVIGGSFDVILTDVNMPGTTGIDLLRVIRAYDLDVPVVLMTGSPQLDTAAEAIELGAMQYLTKPFPLQTLVSAIERASKLHQLAALKRHAFELQGRDGHEAGDVAGLAVSFDRAMDSMWMAFQPILSSKERRIVAYEALMRADEPSLPNPGAILSAAERLDRLNELGRRVRSLVASAIPEAPPEVEIFVNLHTRDLLDPDLASESAPLTGFAERVVLEITERAALHNVKDSAARVEILRYLGYRIALDDLGAGYAGLTSFASLEPEFVKLDMSLVRGIHTSEIKQRLVRSVLSLCQEMGKGIIAEGIEAVDERECLRNLGCDWMQGYLFAKPAKPFPIPAWS